MSADTAGVRLARLALIAVAILSLALLYVPTPDHDQWVLLTRGIAFDGGVASILVAKFTAVFTGDLYWRNVILSTLAGWLALVGAWWALSQTSAPRWLQALCVTAFLGSWLWLTWVSSDVLAAAGIAWLLVAERYPRLLLPASWLLMFSRPDLLVPGWVLSVAVAPRQATQTTALAVIVAGLSLLSPYGTPRLTHSIGQHAAHVLHRHEDSRAFDDWIRYRDADFGQNAQWPEMIRQLAYDRFVIGSIAVSLRELWRSGTWLILLAAGLAVVLHGDRIALGALGFVVVSAVTISLVAFVHYRYLGRYLILALVVLCRAWPDLPRWARGLGLGGLIVLLAHELWALPDVLRDGPYVD